MPLYEVNHCAPLSQEQKNALAEFITDLHATTFTTPRLYVNVLFVQPPPVGQVYVGGKPRGQILPNFIRATVRVGPTRPKKMYDDVAIKIQTRWYEIVNDASLGAQSPEALGAKEQAQLKRLSAVFFCPLLAAVENGLIVPDPGDEGTWLKQNMAHFQEQANVHGNSDIKDMLKEVNERDDLRKLMG